VYRNLIRIDCVTESLIVNRMIAPLPLPDLSVSPFKSKSRLEAENAALRHQLIVLRQKVRGRVQLTNGDSLVRWLDDAIIALRSRGQNDELRIGKF
jgi:hypothetical protein